MTCPPLRAASIAAGAALLLAAGAAQAQFQKPEDAIDYRRSAMTLQSHHLGRLFAMANGRIPFDAKSAADQAEIVAVLNRLQFIAFIDGTDKGDTRAKPEIWRDRAKFDAAEARSHDDVTKLLAAARAGAFEPFKAAVGATGRSCKGCHDEFRKD